MLRSTTSSKVKVCRLFSLVLTFAIISACTTLPNKTLTLMSASQLQEWQARGKVLLKNNDEKVSGYFFWHQNDDNFTLSLNSFIGTNVLTLNYQDDLATLKVDGKSYQGSDPESLIYRITGNQIPVNTMAQWMIANVDESSEHVSQLKFVNAAEQAGSTNKPEQSPKLSSFVYQDKQNQAWSVKYNGYQTYGMLSLPSKLNVQTTQHRIKLTINDWEFIR